MREMRRAGQILTQAECEIILRENTSGVLALHGEDGYPYGVPLSYVYADGKIYFHSAQAGHKIDAVRNNNQASFTIIAQDNIVPEEYTTYFRSVIVFGRVRILENDAEKRNAIEQLAEKYMPDLKEGRLQEIEKEFSRFCMLEFTIDRMTGKEAIELVRAKRQANSSNS